MDGGSVEKRVAEVIIGVGNSGPFVQSLGARHGLEEDLEHELSLCVSQSAFVHDVLSLVHRQAQQDLRELDKQPHLRQS